MPTDTNNNDDEHRTDHDVTRDDYHAALDANAESFGDMADETMGESPADALRIQLQSGTTIYFRLYQNANGVTLGEVEAACAEWRESLDAETAAALTPKADRLAAEEIPPGVDVDADRGLWLGISPSDAVTDAADRRAAP